MFELTFESDFNAHESVHIIVLRTALYRIVVMSRNICSTMNQLRSTYCLPSLGWLSSVYTVAGGDIIIHDSHCASQVE